MSQLFASGGQSIGASASASASVLPMILKSDFFRVDWLDLLAVQGTLKSLLQHRSSKASILQCSAIFMVQLSHPCMTNGKTIALTRWTFVSKVMSLLFNTPSRSVIAFLPRSRSVQFSCSVVSDSLRPYELQHARPPCPSPTPGVYSNSCLSSQ